MWLCHSLFSHSFIEGHMGCFQLLAVITKAAIYIHIQFFRVYENKFSFQTPRRVLEGICPFIYFFNLSGIFTEIVLNI